MRFSLLAVVFIAGSFALPHAAHAGIPFFGPIIPNEQITVNDVVTNQNVCAASWTMLIIVINNIISLFITLAIVFVMPLMLAYSGFLFVVNPVNSGGISKAKGILTSTIVGIVIALAGWLIVDAIMAALYNANAPIGTSTLGTWSELVTGNPSNLCIPLAGSFAPAVTPPPGVQVVPTADCQASYASVLPGINVSSSGNCCDRNNGSCTSLAGMSAATISQIVNVKNRCGATTVTGGTEVGHSSEGGAGSHSSGVKVDIGQNVISCILGTNGSASVNPPSFGQSQVRDRCGNIYTWEGNHTDIYVQSSCSF